MKSKIKDINMYNEILFSLQQSPKSISSKYFYDDKGSEIFQKITTIEEYYLTRSENEILKEIGSNLDDYVQNQDVDVIEIGPGDGTKGKTVVHQVLNRSRSLKYFGVDISDQALGELRKNFSELPEKIQPQLILGDYLQFSNLPLIKNNRKKLICFFGSSIGNLTHNESSRFISEVSQSLSSNDLMLVGFDLKKDIKTMTNAYNDSLGLTRDFNLNLLKRLNREIGAEFDVSKFNHLEYYDEKVGAMLSFLVSQVQQDVLVGEEVIHFEKGERIHTESSYKYDLGDIQSLVQNSELVIEKVFYDPRKYFSCVLFKKNYTVQNIHRDQIEDSRHLTTKDKLWAT